MERASMIENKLTAAGHQMIENAKTLTITSEADYEIAGSVLRRIKEQVKAIKEYWAEPKARAKAAHQEIIDREKEMLKALTDAEAIIKATMREYVDAVEKARKEAEEAEAKRRQEEALDALFADGDGATTVESAIAIPEPVMHEAPKAAGISTRKQWKARVVDEKRVPAYSDDGYELRTVNMSALNQIARMSKGKATIPGVEFYEETVIGARA